MSMEESVSDAAVASSDCWPSPNIWQSFLKVRTKAPNFGFLEAMISNDKLYEWNINTQRLNPKVEAGDVGSWLLLPHHFG